MALLALLGGGLALLIATIPLMVVADLVVSRGAAQVAADAAALAAMAAADRGDGVAADLARANGATLISCCGDDPARRVVTVAATPRSVLLSTIVPRVEARAAAALVAAAEPVGGGAGALDGRASGGRVWPIAASVTSGFGTRTHPLTGTRRLHAGLDLGAPAGAPIVAAAAGTVITARPAGGYGLVVDIRHGDGTTTRYAHQSRILVRAGQQVAAGQAIGLIGSTGASTGPHLHFEVRTPTGNPIDPATWLP